MIHYPPRYCTVLLSFIQWQTLTLPHTLCSLPLLLDLTTAHVFFFITFIARSINMIGVDQKLIRPIQFQSLLIFLDIIGLIWYTSSLNHRLSWSHKHPVHCPFHYTEQLDVCWETKSHSSGQEDRHWFLSLARLNTILKHLFKSTLILSSDLSLGLWSGLFPSDFVTKFLHQVPFPIFVVLI